MSFEAHRSLLDLKDERDPKLIPKHFRLQAGITASLENQLIQHSHSDGVIREFTSDAERFSTLSALHEWLEGERRVYSLTDEAGEKLLGMAWFSLKKLPQEGVQYLHSPELDQPAVTIAKRLYEGARGIGLAVPFMTAVLETFFRDASYTAWKPKVFWSRTSESNASNIHINQKLGFSVATLPDTHGKIVLTATQPDIEKAIEMIEKTGKYAIH